jgi:diguanylate cyclase (GGDEF)-like protein
VDRAQRLLAIVQAQTEIAGAGLDAPALLALVAERALVMMDASSAVAELVEGDGLTVVHVAGSGAAPDGLSERVVAERRTARSADGAAVAVPIVREAEALGALTVIADRAGLLTAVDEETLGLLADVAAAQLTAVTAAGRTMRDDLTGLGNRRAYDERLAHECARRERDGGRLTLVLADVDGLHAINEAHGRVQGDGVLRTVAAVLERWTRAIDGVYRIGGDEFALVLPGASTEVAQALIGRISVQLGDAHPLRPSLCFGAGETTSADARALHASAEAALMRRAAQDDSAVA